MSENIQKLPKDLTLLVNFSLELLGQATQIEAGKSIFNEIEDIRQVYKSVRSASVERKLEVHREFSQSLEKHSPTERMAIAHCFAVSLELINICENVYRSYRLASRQEPIKGKPADPIIFVLTAHPTEARSPKVIQLLNEISDLLRLKIENKKLTVLEHEALFHLIVLLTKTPISKVKSPTVQDEAEYIYSTLLRPANIELLCEYYDQSRPVFIRTWVGGDKDGHPGINEKVMLSSLRLSRQKILKFAKSLVEESHSKLELLDSDTKIVAQLKRRVLSLRDLLNSTKSLGLGDGHKLVRLYKALDQVRKLYHSSIGVSSPELKRLHSLLKVFPGLVVPLELREDSSVIKEALKKPNLAISKMIQTLQKISKGGEASWYARGLVISMCESSDDIRNGAQLLKKHLKSLEIPIVPLYETRLALENSAKITTEFINIPIIKGALVKNWDRKLEIMLGYSDSAKESGALFSRAIIHKTLHKLDQLIRSKNLTPVFFHGSGGSVARGGGSLKEQISWWPRSARVRFKATIQGEMIHRTFSTPEIFKRQVEKIRTSVSKVATDKPQSEFIKEVRKFSELVRLKYLECVEDENFMKMVQMATPYPFLDKLKIGSRPSKRKSGLSLKNLRAIPWVLCWTQTRVHFPVWWGLGSCWSEISKSEQTKLQQAFRHSTLMSSFVAVLAYTLAKVDLSVWAYYLESSELTESERKKYIKMFKNEHELTLKFISEVTGQNELVWFRPWLEESIKLRSTMIYPLNILEIHALRSKDIPLLRETVTGIASGMLTTG